MTAAAATLLKVLQGCPANAPEAIRALRIAGPWSRDGEAESEEAWTWHRRREFDGTLEEYPFDYPAADPLCDVYPDPEERGKWQAYINDDPVGNEELLFLHDSADEAMAAIDAQLKPAWVLR